MGTTDDSHFSLDKTEIFFQRFFSDVDAEPECTREMLSQHFEYDLCPCVTCVHLDLADKFRFFENEQNHNHLHKCCLKDFSRQTPQHQLSKCNQRFTPPKRKIDHGRAPHPRRPPAASGRDKRTNKQTNGLTD